MRQLPLALGERAARTFDNFQPGANGAAIAHLRALGAAAAPAYLWGPSGSGKTHLLRALVGRFEAQGARAGWFSALDAPPWSFDEAWVLAVIDDCDRLDAGQQHAAFALFVEAASHGVPLVAAGRMPPVDLALREDLRTRLGWGHVFAIEPLREAEVRAALRREADRRGAFLSDDVMNYLLTHFERDLGHLMALLDRLDEFSLVGKRAITVPMLKEMIAQERES
ncbi:MAG TPA: DnaA regulatory inactivator Hda [Burkholderiaceae bacterium]|nr:DnaA regulatory inactivator Hda [Burkholderiaceae bacterium]